MKRILAITIFFVFMQAAVAAPPPGYNGPFSTNPPMSSGGGSSPCVLAGGIVYCPSLSSDGGIYEATNVVIALAGIDGGAVPSNFIPNIEYGGPITLSYGGVVTKTVLFNHTYNNKPYCFCPFTWSGVSPYPSTFSCTPTTSQITVSANLSAGSIFVNFWCSGN
jgi:hypothetical protein